MELKDWMELWAKVAASPKMQERYEQGIKKMLKAIDEVKK